MTTTITGTISPDPPAGKAGISPTAASVAAVLASTPSFIAAVAAMVHPQPPQPPPPPPPITCSQNSSSWVSQSVGGGIFDTKQYGYYVINVDNWGNLPGQVTWANSAICWGVTDTQLLGTGGVKSYPHITRGWMNNGLLTTLSTPGTNDWTTKSGMGIAVTSLTKAKIKWTFNAPASTAKSDGTGNRYDALMDIYFHTSATPPPSEFPPFVDLQIIQALDDQIINNTTFYAYTATADHATQITLGGNTYMIFIDDQGGAGFHQNGGHTIALFNLPTSFISGNNNATWGVQSAVTDLSAIVKYLIQPNPIDDSGKPLVFASGATVTAPLIASNLFLTSINAGWEIDGASPFTNTNFWVAMQNEPDGN